MCLGAALCERTVHEEWETDVALARDSRKPTPDRRRGPNI